MRRLCLALPVLLALVLPLGAEENADVDLTRRLEALLAAPDPVQRLRRTLEVLALDPAPDALVRALERARPWPPATEAPAGQEVQWTRRTPDGAEHTVFAYAPSSYAPDRAWPVLIWLHGAVSRPTDGGGSSGIGNFREEAEEKGFLLLSPSARQGAEWWTPAGAALVRGALQDLARRWRVDPDRVAVAGLSDGGSACFHLAVHDPDPYACFLAFIGTPLVTRLTGGPSWTGNLGARAIFAVNGGQDPLYPAEQVRPVIEAMRAAGARIAWTAVEEAGHDGAPLLATWEDAYAFWQEHPREACPREVVWETSVPAREGRRAWVEILEVDSEAPSSDDLAPSLELDSSFFRPRPRLGIRLDVEFPGPGLRIEEVEEETPAAEAGFEPGDVILRAGGTEFATFEEVTALRDYLDGLEEDGSFLVRRGEEEIEIRCRPQVLAKDVPPRPAELGYDRPAGRVEARAGPDGVLHLRTRGVARIRLHLGPPLVDPAAPLVVVWNGVERYRGPVPKDASYLLAQAAREGPGGPVYVGHLDLGPAPE